MPARLERQDEGCFLVLCWPVAVIARLKSFKQRSMGPCFFWLVWSCLNTEYQISFKASHLPDQGERLFNSSNLEIHPWHQDFLADWLDLVLNLSQRLRYICTHNQSQFNYCLINASMGSFTSVEGHWSASNSLNFNRVNIFIPGILLGRRKYLIWKEKFRMRSDLYLVVWSCLSLTLLTDVPWFFNNIQIRKDWDK